MHVRQVSLQEEAHVVWGGSDKVVDAAGVAAVTIGRALEMAGVIADAIAGGGMPGGRLDVASVGGERSSVIVEGGGVKASLGVGVFADADEAPPGAACIRTSSVGRAGARSRARSRIPA